MIESTRTVRVCEIKKATFTLTFDHYINTDQPYIRIELLDTKNERISAKKIHVYDYLHFIKDVQRTGHVRPSHIRYIIPTIEGGANYKVSRDDVDYVNAVISPHIMTNINLLYEKKEMTIEHNTHPDRESYVEYKKRVKHLQHPFSTFSIEHNIMPGTHDALIKYFKSNGSKHPTMENLLFMKRDHLINMNGIGIKGREILLDVVDEWCDDQDIDTLKYPLYQ